MPTSIPYWQQPEYARVQMVHTLLAGVRISPQHGETPSAIAGRILDVVEVIWQKMEGRGWVPKSDMPAE